MSAILALDLVALLAVVAALAWGLRLDARRASGAVKALLLITLSLYLFSTVSNVAEHAGLTAALDPYEDYAEILFFPFAFFFLYATAGHLELTRRRAAEASLRERERMLSALLGNLPGMVYRCRNEPSWPMEFVSGGCMALTGYSATELLDRHDGYARLILAGDRERVWREVQAALAKKAPFRLRYRIRDAAGLEKWVWEQGAAVFDEQGRLAALEGFMTDITDHKRAEEEIEQYRQHLETLVEQRTGELRTARRHLERSLALLRDDEEAGKRIQSKLLPAETALLDGYHFSRNLIPSMYLSGDFIDYFAIDERHVGFYVADVSGHGASSAFVTVFLKSIIRGHQESFRAAGDKTLLDPAATLARVNEELLRENLEKHVTMFYGILNRAEGSLVYANAGQFPFPILWDNGTPELLDGKALPVGLFPEAKYVNCTRVLGGAFVLFLFSDGLLDVLPEGSLASKVAFLAAQGAEDDFDVNKLISSLGLDGVRTFPDDVAFLVVRSESHDARQSAPR